MIIYTNTIDTLRGGPRIWGERFCRLIEKRGFSVTHNLREAWAAALFIVRSEGLEQASRTGRPVGFRVANGYLPSWFQVMGRTMQPEHHAANAVIARALEQATVIIYQSQWAKEMLDELLYCRADHFAVIFNGIDLNQFHPSPEPLGDVPVIGTVGLLRYRYRLETFFEMSRRLDRPHRLLVVGDTDDECSEVLRRAQADPLLGPRLTYQEAVPPDRLPALYQQMSLLVHPVCGDVCPNVVIEAMACGVPVVAPRFGGTAELVGEAGILFDCKPWVYDHGFIEAMSQAASQALAQTTSLSIQARQRAEAHFDIQSMLDRYLQALDLPRATVNPRQAAAVQTTPTTRARASRFLSRPRFLTAMAMRKARQAQRRIFPPRPNPRPRIAFTLFDFHVGGIENWLYRLARQLQGEFDFYFLATKVPDFLPKFREVGTCAYLPGPRQMIAYLQKQNIDILQVHNERWPVDAALAAGVAHIIERLGGQRSWLRVPKYGIDLVIASAQMAIGAISDLIPAERVQLVYNGLDLVEVDTTPMQRLFSRDTLVIGRTSRFGRGQNLGLLIEALDRLRVRLPHLRLVLVGGDSLMPGAQPVETELRRIVSEKGMETIVHFTGLVENTLPFIHGFDIGTCVSNDEGIPNSLIEAMACRKPVISTRVGAIPELVEDDKNGLLIPPGDVDALCAAIECLSSDPGLRQRLGNAGRRTVEEKFSLTRAATQYAEIYHRLLRGE